MADFKENKVYLFIKDKNVGREIEIDLSDTEKALTIKGLRGKYSDRRGRSRGSTLAWGHEVHFVEQGVSYPLKNRIPAQT